MSQPDQQSIVDEIRSAQLVASPDLRARVRATAATAPPTTGRERRALPWRRLALVVVPATVAVALAVSLAAGLRDSGSNGSRNAVYGEAAATPQRSSGAADTFAAPSAKSAGAGGTAGVPATSGRAQLYDAELTLKVGDLSAATKRALRLTRDFHGYVRSVEYGSGSERGSASLVVRVPVGSVQEALVKYSALGQILDQHVSIQDVQPQVDRRFRQLQEQRDLIAKLQAQLESPSLTAARRAQLENRLVAARRQLVLLQKQQAALQRQTSYATVSLDLRTKDKALVTPHEPGRIGRALHRSGQIVAEEAKVLVYVLVVGAPFFLVAAAAIGGLSIRRRRREERLLATS
jgi:hypothetical protein